jgi:uncharacterized protein YbbC (DUF1343 family)
MIETPHRDDPHRRVPIYSLYSETREPTAAMLRGLDVLLVDLQDIGARIYTYIYTLANCLTACARHGVPVIVCDRPNPIGGSDVEGATLRAGFESFVGQFPIPMRHGMTIGEIARLFNQEFGLGANLDVAAMEGWQRGMYCRRDRAAVGDAVTEHADARTPRSCTRERCCSKGRCSRRGAAPRGRSSSLARPGSKRSALPVR